jgi:hypothetical protein
VLFFPTSFNSFFNFRTASSMFILYNQERDINQDLYLPDIPSGYLTFRHGKWPIEIDGYLLIAWWIFQWLC